MENVAKNVGKSRLPAILCSCKFGHFASLEKKIKGYVGRKGYKEPRPLEFASNGDAQKPINTSLPATSPLQISRISITFPYTRKTGVKREGKHN